MSTEKNLTDARRVLEKLEERRESLASRFASVERERSEVVLAAMSGDKAAKSEADRLAAELANISADAVDCETALVQARANLAAAQAAADAVKRAEREAEAREIVAAQLKDSAKIDELLSEVSALLQVRRERCSKLTKLGMLQGNRAQHPSRIVEAMAAAGLREYAGGIVRRGQSLAESDATSLPFGRKVAA